MSDFMKFLPKEGMNCEVFGTQKTCCSKKYMRWKAFFMILS